MFFAKQKGAKHLKKKKKPKIFLIILVTLIFLYGLCVFFPPRPIRTLRNIWIETAMTTSTHQWLATAFIPNYIIEGVMKDQIGVVPTIGGLPQDNENKTENQPDTSSAAQKEDIKPEKNPKPAEETRPKDILGQEELIEGERNEHGDLVVVNNKEEGLVILRIETASYTAHLALIDDSSRVRITTTDEKGAHGKVICDYLERENAILGINANGFRDENGHGKGGNISGMTYENGAGWGEYNSGYTTFGFTEDDNFIVGPIGDWDAYKIRDGAQFNPALIINSEVVTAGSNGWGLQPRTCVGQTADGVALLLVIDGRQVGYSIGATVGDCAEILTRYGAINACCCDGGSSSVMAYDGKLITTPSTNMKQTGRWLPNAFIVDRKNTVSNKSKE